MKKIGIICAMKREADQLLSRLQGQKKVQAGPFEFVHGTLNGCEIVLSQSGMGKVNAAMNALEMIKNFMPDSVINSGVGGGLAGHLHAMDTIIGEQYVYHDVWCGDGNEYGQVQELPTFYPADKTLLTAAEKLHAQNREAVHTGLICTGDQFISGKESIAKILHHFPQALACDMESAAIAQVCYRYHVPFLSMRLISDVAGKESSNMAQYEHFWETMADKGFARTWALLHALTAQFASK
ncbi:MAG: 5'-methylthioadenosine/adenosylhomocysteine nucleosidase [Elusimicrobiaceae bacterium]|nr:5'-methylthioadenosine/adenosylhomocysteine nucleosidase [Elusimicrobiaceae bacterium]